MTLPSVGYLTQQGRRHRWSAKSDDALGLMVVDAFLAAGRAYVLAPCHFDGLSDTDALTEAIRWAEDRRAAAWASPRSKRGKVITQLQSWITSRRTCQRRSGYQLGVQARLPRRWGDRFGRVSPHMSARSASCGTRHCHDRTAALAKHPAHSVHMCTHTHTTNSRSL